MVGLGGLEPPASPLSGVRSNQLSYRPGFTLIACCTPRCMQLFVQSHTNVCFFTLLCEHVSKTKSYFAILFI